MFEKTKQQAFANFPDNFAKIVNRSMKKRGNYNNAAGDIKLQLNLTLNNATAADLTFELFSFLDSFTRRVKAEYVTGAFLYVPLLTHEGLVRAIADTGGTVGFDSDGNLDILGANNAAARAVISCDEISYSALFYASAVMRFNIAYIRMTVTTDPQIDKSITYFSKSFSGGIKEQRLSPRSYFRPNQFQTKTLDLSMSFPIEIDKGLKLVVIAGEVVKMSLFIAA